MKTTSRMYWPIALFGSIALHFLALVGIAIIVSPDPIDPQNPPKSQINVQTQDVKQVAAQETKATTDPANEQSPQSKMLTQGAIPKSKADPIHAAGNTVSTKPFQTQVTKQLKVTATATSPKILTETRATSVRPNQIQETKQLRVTAKATSPKKLTQTQATSVRPNVVPDRAKAPSSKQVETSPIQAILTEQLETPAQKTPAVPPASDIALSTSPSQKSVVSDSLDLPTEHGQASLAWSGGDDAVVEAASLNAIQAFMQPSDLMRSGGAHSEVRDGIATVLASVPCARLQATFLPETGQLEVRGHIPQDALRGPVLAALKQQVGNAIPVTDQLLILPRPQCGALSGIADVGLPQSTEQLTNPRVIGASGFAQNYTYFEGQNLTLELVAPDYGSYVYVDFFTADGMVIHLQPNEVVPLEFTVAKSPLTVGKNRGGKPFLELTIGPPYGQEIAAAFASSVVLYRDPRPIQEPAETYLKFLKDQVTEARRMHADFKGEWVYFFISTAQR